MNKSYLITFIVCLLFIVSCFLLVFFVWREIYLPKTPGFQKEIIFSIQRGDKSKEIALNLKKENLIKSAFLFRFYTLLTGVSKKLQAGYYLLSPSMTIPEITQKIVSGDVIKEKITIVEGWTEKEIADYLEEKGIVNAEKFLSTLNLNWEEKYDFLRDKPVDRDIGGYLFPDTYFVEYASKEEEIIQKMLDNFGKKLNQELREEINRQGKTTFEIITMASMLEKEVKTMEDKKIVSGILWKRLENGIPLQVDATISYITGKKTTKISVEETQIDSPYNTYKYKGLPLGPICNPGFESILALIYPEENDFWYYLSTSEGKTIFSRTLEEHNLAKAKYLK